MPRHILAIDQGTTNTKALLFDERGQIAASASRPVPVEFPLPGWVEQDAEELWRTVVDAAGDCLAQAAAGSPAAIGIANQRESVVVWERSTSRPVGPCVVWQCRRTAPFCDELRRRGAARSIAESTGLGIDPLFSASKARWLLEHTPDGFARAASGELAIGTVDSWLLWNLSGGAVHACDFTNASRTQLLNLRRLEWDREMLEWFGIPLAALPVLGPSSHVYGKTAGAGNIPAGVPIAALAGDSHAALFGHAIFRPGQVKATYGTGSSVMTLTDQPVRAAGLSTTIAWSCGGETRYALEGNISTTGGAVQWVGELLGIDPPADGAAQLAAAVTDSGGVYLVPAFVGLGAPHWDEAARGAITGLTRGTTAAHLARAAVESIAYQVRDVIEAMERAGCSIPWLLADGGGSRNPRLMQFQADILGRPVVRSTEADVSARGAAWLAGLAVGVWQSMEVLASLPRGEDRFEPRMEAAERERLYAGWCDAVGQALPPANRASHTVEG